MFLFFLMSDICKYKYTLIKLVGNSVLMQTFIFTPFLPLDLLPGGGWAESWLQGSESWWLMTPAGES